MPARSSSEDRTSPEHALRQRFLEAADRRFKTFGYGKTTVSEIADDVGFSKAYIYKFFASKQVIADATTKWHLDGILRSVDAEVAKLERQGERLRRLYSVLVAESVRLFFDNRQLYEICAVSAVERWGSSMEFIAGIEERLAVILSEGRRTGEFERKTPLAVQKSAIGRATAPLLNPLTLQYQLDDAGAAMDEVTALILRSLAP